MTDRIKIILKSRNLSPSQFADEIDVQRSSVSHILSGRNKPSLDFVTKILTSYPEVSSDWLLLGKGNMLADPDYAEQIQSTGKSTTIKKENSKAQAIDSSANRGHGSPIMEKATPGDKGLDEQEIKEIIIFYNNSTFKVYKPS